MTDSEKLDTIINKIGNIESHIAVSKVYQEDHNKRLMKVEKVTDNYKTDKAKIIGASSVLSILIAWIIKHF